MITNSIVRDFRRFLRDRGIDDNQYTNAEIVSIIDDENRAEKEGRDTGVSHGGEPFDADASPDLSPEDLEVLESIWDRTVKPPAVGIKSLNLARVPSELNRENAFSYGQCQTQEIACGTCQFYKDASAQCGLYSKLNSSNPEVWKLDTQVSAMMWCAAHVSGVSVKSLVAMSAMIESMGGAFVKPPQFGIKAEPQQNTDPGKGIVGPGVFLFRHGKTQLNSGVGKSSPDIIRGWVDVPLDSTGVKDAKEASEMAAKLNLSKLYSSDLERAKQTAQIIGERIGLQPVFSMAFRPWNLGDFQGKPTKDSLDELKKYSKNETEPVPGGESFNDFQNRFIPNLHKIMDDHARTGENVGIVAHFRNVKLSQAWIDAGMDGLDLKSFWKDDAPTGSIIRISRNSAGQWKWFLHEEPEEIALKQPAKVSSGKSATPGGAYGPGPGRFRNIRMEEEGQTTTPPTQEYLDVWDLNQALDRENSSATGGPNPAAPNADDIRQSKPYGTASFDLPVDISQKIMAWGQKIPPEELAERGFLNNGHILNAHWGLHGNDPDAVKEIVAKHQPFGVKLGKTSVFPDKEHDIVKLDVESPELHALHHGLKQLPHTASDRAYRPHVVLGYLKKGYGQKYAGDGFLAGVTVPMSTLVFSDSEQKRTTMALGGVDQAQNPSQPLDGIPQEDSGKEENDPAAEH